VRQECLSYALAVGPIEGVWGGTSESERHGLRAASQRPQMLRRTRIAVPSGEE
jgi:WhiB family redox-sensing transcriptional regulator